MDQTPAAPPTPPAPAVQLSVAEQNLLDAARQGLVGQPDDLRLPFDDPALAVRAFFVRFLAMETDPAWRVHERGVRLKHLRVIGFLDLAGCEVRRPLRFEDCQLDDVSLTGAKLATLSFDGGSAESLEGDRLSAAAVFLRGVTVRQGTRFLGAQVAGDLDCEGAKLYAAQPGVADGRSNVIRNDVALGLDGATVGGAVFLRRTVLYGSMMANSLTVAKVFDARQLVVSAGGVELHSATLGGDADFGAAVLMDAPREDGLVLTQARVAGTLRLAGGFQTNRRVMLNDARIAGNLSLRGARFVGAIPFAVSAQRMQVEGTFDLASTTCFGVEDARAADAGQPTPTSRLAPRRPPGQSKPERAPGCALDLTAASVGSLSDQWTDWPRGNRVLGFRYKEIAGATSTSAAWWEDWLKLQLDEDLRKLPAGQPGAGTSGFKPQPWNQVALGLSAAGCARDAEDVAIAKETVAHGHDKGFSHLLHVLWGWCAAYGYRPLRLLWALPFIYVFSVWVFSEAADRGVMAPTKEELIANAEYQRCHPEHGGNWARCALAPTYPDFNAWAYALQTLLPAVEARQSKDWAPVPWVRPVVPIDMAAPAAHGVASAASASAGIHAPVAGATSPASGWGRFALYWSWIEATFGLAAPVLVGLAWSGLIQRKPKE